MVLAPTAGWYRSVWSELLMKLTYSARWQRLQFAPEAPGDWVRIHLKGRFG